MQTKHTPGRLYINGGPHHSDGRCVRCGKKLVSVVQLELDQRTGEYHDFGGVPANLSQGWFEFGLDCASILRARAAKARGA